MKTTTKPSRRITKQTTAKGRSRTKKPVKLPPPNEAEIIYNY